ncbi:MAG: hypothetical protein CM15mP21_1600 [Hyphomicrobiales bacterium]|nr:MAG: hypothetical protein CM15mP21_1600 [Hyphomicrobiales bacterium]
MPGKEDFTKHSVLTRMIEKLGIDLHLNTRVDADMLVDGGFDNIIIATGISRVYRNWKASTVRRLSAMSTRSRHQANWQQGSHHGRRRHWFDVADFISHDGPSAAQNIDVFAREWELILKTTRVAGLPALNRKLPARPREIFLMQRKETAVGKGLGKTTGWTHRLTLSRRGVKMMNGIEYLKIDDRAYIFCATITPTILRWTRSSSVPGPGALAGF